MWRFGVAPDIDIGFHDASRVIDVVPINTRAMSFVLAGDLKPTNRSAVAFATAGYSRLRRSMPCAIKIGFLCPQAHNDRRASGMRLR